MNQRIKTFLMVSVILNALLAGAVLGEALHSFSRYLAQHAMTPPASSGCCAPALEDRLPEAKRKLLEDILRPAWEKMQAAHAKIDDEKKKALSLLKAEPFDEKAYRSQIRHINDMHAQMKKDIAEAVTKLAGQFTPGERAILADIISHPVPNTPPQP